MTAEICYMTISSKAAGKAAGLLMTTEPPTAFQKMDDDPENGFVLFFVSNRYET